MHKFTALAAAVLMSFSLAACASTNAPEAAASGPAAEAIAAAKAAQKAAASVGHEWRDTAKMIEESEKLAKEGNNEKAIKLAKEAEAQGKAALAQAESQKSAGPRF
jgi:hypothetical protein